MDRLPKIASASRATDVVAAASFALLNWESWGRIDDEGRATLLGIIADPRLVDLFVQQLLASTSGPISRIFAQLCRTPTFDHSIEQIARHAIQPSMRAWAYRSLFECRAIWVEGREWRWTDLRYCRGRFVPIVAERPLVVRPPMLELLRRSAADRSSLVRRVSAEFLIRNLESLGLQAKGFALKFAADDSNMVSERGRFALRRLEDMGRSAAVAIDSPDV